MAKETETEQKSKGGGLMGIVAGLVAAMILGAGGFYATYSGMVSVKGASPGQEKRQAAPESADPGVAFVALEPLVVSLAHSQTNRHLRFTAELEVAPSAEKEVKLLTPRVLDVLNGYLRAVDPRDIEDPASLARLRAQMLRRVQVVTGKGLVRDLLITEFVLN